MPIYKRCSRCNKRIPEGTTCECAKKKNQERYREYDKTRRDAKAKAFYNSKEWESARAAAIDIDDGIDVYLYMTQGIIEAADMVHHIAPLRDDWDKRADVGNLISLSNRTHGEIEEKYKKNKTQTMKELTDMLIKYRSKEGEGGIKKVLASASRPRRLSLLAQISKNKKNVKGRWVGQDGSGSRLKCKAEIS